MNHQIPTLVDYECDESNRIAEVRIRPAAGRPLEPVDIPRPNSANGGPVGRGRGRGRGATEPQANKLPPSNQSLSFENMRRVSSFKVGPNGEYLPDDKPPILRLPHRLTHLRVDLNQGFEKAKLLTRDPNTGKFVPDCHRGRTMSPVFNGSSNGDADSQDSSKIPLDPYMRYFYQRLIDTNYFENCRVRPQFVVSGRSLSGMMQTPFDEDKNWDILVSKVGGIIFLVFQTSPIDVKLFNLKFSNKSHQQELLDQERATFHGLKFRKFVTVNTDENKDDDALTEVEKFFRILEAHFAGFKLLLLTKQIDAFEPLNQGGDPLSDEGQDVEITCCRFNPDAPPNRQKSHAPWRLMRLWSDSIVSGISKVVTGFRFPHGELDEIVVDNVDQLPRKLAQTMANNRRPMRVPYDTKTCLVVLKNIFSVLYAAKLPNDPQQSYLFRMKPYTQEAELFQLPHGQHLFLPSSLIDTIHKAFDIVPNNSN